MNKPFISVVIPVYGCNECLSELYKRITSALMNISPEYEIILIDDNYCESPWPIIKLLAEKDKKVSGIRLSRNFGQHSAITAGLEHAKGEWIVVMDCDLQDKPEEILNLYKKATEGYDVVLGRRMEKKHSIVKRLFSNLFYKILGYLTNTKQDCKIANFGIYHRKVIQAVCSMHDHIRYFPAMIKWVGFHQTYIDIDHGERYTGKTTYSFRKLLRLGIEVILAFSDKPLRLTVKAGALISFFSVIYAVYIFIKYLTGNISVPGYTSIFISIWFLAGIIIAVLGMVGLYIGKTFEKVKDRPVYIINEKINV